MRFTTTTTLSTLSLLLALPTLSTATPCKANEVGVGYTYMSNGQTPQGAGVLWVQPTIFATDCGVLASSHQSHYCNMGWDDPSGIVACDKDRKATGVVLNGRHYGNCYSPASYICAAWLWGKASAEMCCIRDV
ncbi:hypothetical protein VE04_09936 [Pseudogymnoascus sp. 24MN13]|jgi:hypothetical protein|nr:hypothetical protein VE04_09936 [Pseudogymnoascus sp. 24MN13]